MHRVFLLHSVTNSRPTWQIQCFTWSAKNTSSLEKWNLVYLSSLHFALFILMPLVLFCFFLTVNVFLWYLDFCFQYNNKNKNKNTLLTPYWANLDFTATCKVQDWQRRIRQTKTSHLYKYARYLQYIYKRITNKNKFNCIKRYWNEMVVHRVGRNDQKGHSWTLWKRAWS